MKLKYQPEDLFAELLSKIIEYCDDPKDATRTLARIGLIFLQGEFGRNYQKELDQVIQSIKPE